MTEFYRVLERCSVVVRPIYTTHNFWYGMDKIGTDETWTIYLGSPNFIRTNFIRTKPKIEHSVNG